ncbi:hypothetical protein NSQ77_05220 [Oceanobacillus sp. FSL K6-2867]|uniref:hypothetical protein n=1 Tax=Oceanobacillus sp. FSL K6-2867 TaxID=2954748 RepID=UPI0030DCB8FF
MGLKQNIINAFLYLTTKLAGAGFLYSVMSIYFLIATGFDLYEYVEETSHGFLLYTVYVYGIACSIIIDLITYKIPKKNYSVKILLYIVAGYAYFMARELSVIMFIAGTVGALCSVLFYFGTYKSFRSQTFKYTVIIAPLFFIILLNFDFTEKENWVEVGSDHSYTATFEYFNGKHEIPIHLKEGQTITVFHDFNNTNGGGHGFHVLNEINNLVGMTEVNEKKVRLKVQDSGVYRIVVTGDDVKGSFIVTWEIEKDDNNESIK